MLGLECSCKHKDCFIEAIKERIAKIVAKKAKKKLSLREKLASIDK